MSECKQADHGAASLLLALPGKQRLECTGISATRERLIAIDQIDERHRLLAQRMDDVMIVDDVAVLAAPLRRRAAPQSQGCWMVQNVASNQLTVGIVLNRDMPVNSS
ncbi:MAG: hypothetical protein ACXW3N_12130 [Rhodoplanes sp.]